MEYDPRTIALEARIFHQPIELPADKVQQIHNTLFHRPEISYQNFQVAYDGIHLSNLAETPGSVSVATFAPDRIVLREELRGTTLEEFATRVVNVVTVGYQTLGIPLSVAQQFLVRTLVNPRHSEDSRDFLLRRVVRAPEEVWAGFGRPIQIAGLRLTFPQTTPQGEVYDLRIETWGQDPRSLWIENIGSFNRPTPTENLPDLGNFLYATYKFVTGPVSRFLAHFDEA